MTRMFGDFVARPGVSPGAAAEGYYNTPNFTIMQAIYYMSSLAEATNDLPETPVNGVPGQVNLPYAGNSTSAAPTIQQPQPPMPAGQVDQFISANVVIKVAIKFLVAMIKLSVLNMASITSACSSNPGSQKISSAPRIGLPKHCLIKPTLSSNFGMHGSSMPTLETMRLLFTFISDRFGENLFHACVLRPPSIISML